MGRRAVLLKIPALPETTDPAITQPRPISPLHTPAQHVLGIQPKSEPSEKGEE